jgi:hypothetical protein
VGFRFLVPILGILLPNLGIGREGIEVRDYLAESKGIFGIPEKVTPILNPQKAWLLADVFGL